MSSGPLLRELESRSARLFFFLSICVLTNDPLLTYLMNSIFFPISGNGLLQLWGRITAANPKTGFVTSEQKTASERGDSAANV